MNAEDFFFEYFLGCEHFFRLKNGKDFFSDDNQPDDMENELLKVICLFMFCVGIVCVVSVLLRMRNNCGSVCEKGSEGDEEEFERRQLLLF